MLDREGTDAPVRIENPRLGKGVRRAGIETSGAGAAVIDRQRRVGGQHEVGEDRREKEVTAGVRRDQHRVLADPAEPREPCEIAFGQRGRIDDTPRPKTWHPLLQPLSEGIRPRPQQVVVVVAPGVAGHTTAAWLGNGASPFPGGWSGSVVGGEHDDAPRPGKKGRRIGPQRIMAGKPVLHRPREPPGKPTLECLVVRRQPDGCYAHAGESQPLRLAAKFGCQQRCGTLGTAHVFRRITHRHHQASKTGNLGCRPRGRFAARQRTELIWTQSPRSLSSAPIVPDGGSFPNRLPAE